MAKLFVIAGHGAGDPGAEGFGYNEAERVRALASRLKALGGNEVIIGDTSRNWYADNGIGRGDCPSGVPVIELHMDSAVASARGGHVIIKAGYSADSYDTALADFIGNMFPGRSNTIVGRSDLANPNRAAIMGVNYRLLECCFISNQSDLNKFNSQMDELAKGILAAFGITANATTTPSQPTTPNAPSTSTGYIVRVTTDVLNIRSGAGTNNSVVGTVKKGDAYTIVAEADGAGANKWGKLKSGAGWISLDFTERVDGSTTSTKKSIDEIAQEVINGDWGNGEDRKNRLTAAGYNYNEVQARVNQLV